jgi:hypothetical protein
VNGGGAARPGFWLSTSAAFPASSLKVLRSWFATPGGGPPGDRGPSNACLKLAIWPGWRLDGGMTVTFGPAPRTSVIWFEVSPTPAPPVRMITSTTVDTSRVAMIVRGSPCSSEATST